ncbi:MAG: LysE family translocator [Pseudomonadota bacterium]|nr:LysE family translocator [Pseudomonadota bacterium]
MSVELYLAFVAACVLLALTPGPALSLIIANGAAHGRGAAVSTVAGNSLGLGLLVTGAAVGLGTVLAVMADWFDVIRWVGAAYLVWLGGRRLLRAWRSDSGLAAPVRSVGRRRWALQGTMVALSNPKVLLFLGAFFPQFVNPDQPAGPQLALLAATFLVVVSACDLIIAFAAGAARTWLTERRARVADAISGSLLVCGGLWLALQRR